MRNRWSRTVLGLLVMMVPACGGAPDAPRSMHADSAGIDVVTDAGTDRPLAWSLDTRFELGGKENDNESFYQLGSGAWIGADSTGHLFILDPDGHRILVFDSTGTFVRRMGGEGGGPGEFTFALAFDVMPDGTSAVFDIGKRSFVRYAFDGTLLDEMRTPPTFFGGTFALGPGSLTVTTQKRDSTVALNSLVVATATDTTTIASLEQTPGGVVQFKSCGMSIRGIPPIFSPTLRWVGSGTRTVVATSDTYEMRVYDGDRLVRIIRRAIPPEAATKELAIREQGDGMKVRLDSGTRTCEPAEVVDQQGFAETVPTIRRMQIDPLGRIWVDRAHTRYDPPIIDVFGPEGDYIGTLPDGTPFPATFLSADRVVTIRKDELDVERAVVQEIRESDGS
jgi:6-bladed beta-propeller